MADQSEAPRAPAGTQPRQRPEVGWPRRRRQEVSAHQMEVYATLTEHADYEVGRLVDAIDELGELDNTLFFYIFGDNGGSVVGDLNGCFVEWSRLNEAPRTSPTC